MFLCFLQIFALFSSGILVAMGFPGYIFPTLGLGIVIPFSLIPVFFVIETLSKDSAFGKKTPLSPKKVALRAFFCAWIFGFIVQLFAFFWISQPIIYFSTLPPVAAYALYVFISSLTSLYFPALFSPFIFEMWYRAKEKQRGSVDKKFPVAAMAMIMVLLEISVPRFFDWSFAALMHSETYINQLASLLSFNAVSFLVFYTNLSLARMLAHVFAKDFKLRQCINVLARNGLLWGTVILFGFFRIQQMDKTLATARTTRIAYVQSNFTFNSIASTPLPSADSQVQDLNRLIEMSYDSIAKSIQKDGKKPDLLVWPESAAPNTFSYNPQDVLKTQELTAKTGVPVLVETIKWKPKDSQKQNIQNDLVWSVSYVIYPDGSKSKDFEKWIPMPFGEAFPLEKYFPILGTTYRKIFDNASKLELGTSYDALPYTDQDYVAPLICFDSIYPNLPRLETFKGKATVFINQANFVWMVQSNAGLEFSILDQFRAIENARSLVLVSNTGPTTAFDPLGRVLLPKTTLLTQNTGFVDLPVYTGTTFYSRYSNWPLIIAGLLSILWIIFLIKRKNHS